MTRIGTLLSVTLSLAIAGALAVGAAPAHATGSAGWSAAVSSVASGSASSDKVYLKDGRVLEGQIKQELDGYVWIVVEVGGITQERVLDPGQIDRIERDAPQADPVDAAQEPAESEPAPVDAAARAPEGSGTARARIGAPPRGAVLSLGVEREGKGMIGLYVTAESLARARELLKEDGIEVVVLLINSGGGLGREVQLLSDEIHYNFKNDFHTIAWIESAISAAAMAAHCMPNIVFKTSGAYGACTGYRGAGDAIEGRELEEMLYTMEQISDRGGHDHSIMRAMQITEPLSATVLGNGRVKWYQSLDGDYIVNSDNTILTFTADQAERFGFSQGTADTLDELTRLLGYTEIEWVGDRVPGVPYPVSRAEKYLREFRDAVHRDDSRFNEYVEQYNGAIALAQQTPLEERGKFVNRARDSLQKIIRMVRNNSNFLLLYFGIPVDQFDEWVREQEELLRDLMK